MALQIIDTIFTSIMVFICMLFGADYEPLSK